MWCLSENPDQGRIITSGVTSLQTLRGLIGKEWMGIWRKKKGGEGVKERDEARDCGGSRQ